MHMADALLSPAVGGVMTAAAAAAIGYSVKKISKEGLDEKKIPMMGVMGAFVFAAQMINFTIPGTGSSGHIGGGILLAALLGPFPAFITLASVLLIQCLFFADGGLLAYGCNVFNMGFCACLLVYPLIFKPIVKRGINKKSITIASVISVVAGLQLGAFCVVSETMASGVTALPFGAFAALMQPIHLAIGLGEGLATAAVLCFIYNIRPEIIECSATNSKVAPNVSIKKVVVLFAVSALLIGGGLSLFASSLPDGLEWSIERVAGTPELERGGTVHDAAAGIADSVAIMPDYDFAGENSGSLFGTATAGILGSGITVLLAGGAGFIIYLARKKAPKLSSEIK